MTVRLTPHSRQHGSSIRVAYGSRGTPMDLETNGTVRDARGAILFLLAFPHIYVRSGYILGAIACAYACRLPPRTKPRFASLVPKGSLSLSQKVFLNKILSTFRENRTFLWKILLLCYQSHSNYLEPFY